MASRGVIGRAGVYDLGPARHLGHRDIPPRPARIRAGRGIGGDDDDRSASFGARRRQRRFEFGKARHLARYGAKACGMAGEVDARAVGEEIIERGAAATALQPVDAAEPIIVEDVDVELLSSITEVAISEFIIR